MALDLKKPLLLSGDLYIGTIDSAGVREALLPKFEVDALSVTPSAETVEQKSKSNAAYGRVRSSIILPGDTEIALSPMDLPAEVMAMIMLGAVAALTQASGSVTDEPITGVLDRWVELPHRQIGASPAFNIAPAGAALTLGTDFDIEYVSGMYRALTAQAAAVVEGDYSHAAIAGKSVSISTATNVNRWMRLVGVNLHDGEKIIFEAWRIKLRPTSNLDLMANQHVVAGLTGKMEESLDPLDASAVGLIHYLGA